MINWFKQILGMPTQKKSAYIAKERLMVIVAHERGSHPEQPDFLPLLQKELTDVIAKYVKIDRDQVQVEFEQRAGRSVLELNIMLPEEDMKQAFVAKTNAASVASAANTPVAVAKPIVKTKKTAPKKAKTPAVKLASKKRGRPPKVK